MLLWPFDSALNTSAWYLRYDILEEIIRLQRDVMLPYHACTYIQSCLHIYPIQFSWIWPLYTLYARLSVYHLVNSYRNHQLKDEYDLQFIWQFLSSWLLVPINWICLNLLENMKIFGILKYRVVEGQSKNWGTISLKILNLIYFRVI